jgi:leader peptidase (prepilin peptidase)/N-methyltransferase
VGALLGGVGAILGLVVGSFVNVVVARVPVGESVVRPRSRCPACGSPIAARDNVPLVSFLALRGHCRSCGVRIPLRYPLVEAVLAALFAGVALRFGAAPALAAFWWFSAALVAVSAVDLERRLVPRRIVYPALAGSAVLLGAASAWQGTARPFVDAAIGGAVAFLALAVVHLAKPQGMGFGDVRLAGLIGANLGWLGLAQVAVGLFLGFASAAVVGLGLVAAGRAGPRTRLPFAPFLAAGALATVFAGRVLVRAWLG